MQSKIKTEEQYRRALDRVDRLVFEKEGECYDGEADRLVDIIIEYEDGLLEFDGEKYPA